MQFFDANNDDHIDMYELIDGVRSEANKNPSKYDVLFSKEKVSRREGEEEESELAIIYLLTLDYNFPFSLKSVLNTIEYICD